MLGPLEVRADGRTIRLASGKARLLFGALVVHANRVVSVDRLFEILWGPEPPETAPNTLQTYVAHLRTTLEPGRARRRPTSFLLTRHPGYVLEIDPDGIDAARFEQMARDGQRLLSNAPDAGGATLRGALSLWRGDPYADFTFEPFAQADITRLGELRLSVLEDRIESDLCLGGHAGLIGELSQLVSDQPLRERLWGQLMVALYRSGRQAEALATFARLRDTLREQLGIDPGPAVCRLEEAVLRQDPDLEVPLLRQRLSPATVGGRPEQPPTDVTRQSPGDADAVEGMRAVARHDWTLAFDRLSVADAAGGLDGWQLNALADAALWTGRAQESLSARQRAHALFVQEEAPRSAAMMSIVLCIHFAARLRFAVAGGWFQRAQRLLEGAEDCPECGYLLWCGVLFSIATGDAEAALHTAAKVYELGRRLRVPDLEALGLTYQGYVHIHCGRVDEGLPLLDEGMTWAVGGEVSPLPSALIFCRTISTCYELGDFRRAAEWMDAIEACFERTGIGAFPGDCEAHRVGILVGRGAWLEAEVQARKACACMEPAELSHVGLALSEIGEIRLRCGDLDGAEQAFARAAMSGARPYPGVALLQLARGDIATATATIGRAIAEERSDGLACARLLPAQVEIALAARDLETAAAAAEDLASLAATYPVASVTAASRCTLGAVMLAHGDSVGAVASLRLGVDGWRRASAPYDAARARLVLAKALARSGDAPGARVELHAARAAFESLGARLDLQRADEQAGEAPRPDDGASRETHPIQN